MYSWGTGRGPMDFMGTGRFPTDIVRTRGERGRAHALDDRGVGSFG